MVFKPTTVSAERSIVMPVFASWTSVTPALIALASNCWTAAALETPDSWTTARRTQRPKTRLPGVSPVGVAVAAMVVAAVVIVDEAVTLVVTVVEVAVVKLVHVDDEVTMKGIVVVKVNVSVVVTVIVFQNSVLMTFMTGAPRSPFRTTTSAVVLPFRFTRLFCSVQLTLLAANCSTSRSDDSVN